MAKGKVKLSPTDVSAKWSRRLKGAVTDIQAGIDAVDVSPAEKAIAKKEKMLQNVTAAIQDGRWEKGLAKVTLQDWKNTTKEKVAQRLGQGVDKGMQKRQQFDNWLVGRLNQKLPEIAAMPDMTLEDNIAKMVAMTRHMAEQKYKAQ